jgi:hypothetical protein
MGKYRRSVDIVSLAGGPFDRRYLPDNKPERELQFAARFCELLTLQGVDAKVLGLGDEEPADVLIASGDERISLQIGEAFDENRRRRSRIADRVLDGLWTRENSRRYSGMSFCFVECGVDTSEPKLTLSRLRAIKVALRGSIEEGFVKTRPCIDGYDPQRCVEIELEGLLRVSVHYSRYAPELMQLPPRCMWVLGGVMAVDIPDVFVPIAKTKINKYPKIATPFWLLIYGFQSVLSQRAVRDLTEAISEAPSMPFDKVYVVSGGKLTQVFPLGDVDHLPEKPGLLMSASDCLPVANDDRWRDVDAFDSRAQPDAE